MQYKHIKTILGIFTASSFILSGCINKGIETLYGTAIPEEEYNERIAKETEKEYNYEDPDPELYGPAPEISIGEGQKKMIPRRYGPAPMDDDN